MVSEHLNAGYQGVAERYDYTEPRYLVHPAYGPGCQYDLIARGGMGGYPDGYILEDRHFQNWVVPVEDCPVGYSMAVRYDFTGAALKSCVKRRGLTLGACEQSCEVCVGDE